MTTLAAGNVGVDMSTWAFEPGWKGVSHSATQFVIQQKNTTKVDTFTGHDFGGYDGNGFPTLGTITGLSFAENSQLVVTMTDFSMTVADERAFASAQNMSGFLNQIFAGDDDFKDGSGTDHLIGFNGNDTFHMTNGGSDTADGGFGDDDFDYADAFDAADSVNGDSGFDQLFLGGDYSGGVVFNASTMTGIERIEVADGHSYDLTVNNANLSFTQLTVDASALTSLNDDDEDSTLTFDGSGETDSSFHLIGGDFGDTLIGGAQGDYFDGGEGGDTMNGNDGSDTVDFGRAFNGVYADLQNGFAEGQGSDTLVSIENVYGSQWGDTIYGSDAGNFILGNDGGDWLYGYGGDAPFAGGAHVNSVNPFDGDYIDGGEGFDHIFGGDGFDTLYGGSDDDEIYGGADGDYMDGGSESDSLYGDGGDDTVYGGTENDYMDGGEGGDTMYGGRNDDRMYGGDDNDVLRGDHGKDRLYGGNGDDRLVGGANRDILDGGEGADTFHFDVNQRGTAMDTVVHLDASEDKIDLSHKPTALDENTSGFGSLESLFSDLGAHHAQLGLKLRGDIDTDGAGARERGTYYIAVDLNGEVGFQQGEDLIVRLKHPDDVQSLDIHDFI